LLQSQSHRRALGDVGQTRSLLFIQLAIKLEHAIDHFFVVSFFEVDVDIDAT